MAPRSSFQIVAACITIFSCLVLYLSSSREVKGHLDTFLSPDLKNRTTIGSFTNVRPILSLHYPETRLDQQITNSTLGFQKIYAISMPHRSDKRDYIVLMGLISHLNIDIVDGVNGSEMHPKARPAVSLPSKSEAR